MIRVMILGSKEYPFGTNQGDDKIPSGGMETYVNDLAPALSKLCELHIVTRRFKGTEPSGRAGHNISVSRVRWLRGKWLRNISFNLSSFLFCMRKMRGTDIIYSNGIVAGFFALLLGRLFNKPSVFRPAGISFVQHRSLLRNVLFALERFVFGKSDAVIFHSEGELRNARRFFRLPLDNGHVILTGFPVHRFSDGKPGRKKSMFGIRPGEPVITSVSRFVPVKGLDNLIGACSMLESDFRLLLVGSGPLLPSLRQLAGDYGIQDRVMFPGFRHDVPDILAMSDIFVISSLFEGLPTSLLEAMAAGLACVVTDIGLPVRDGQTGLVVRPGDPVALAKSIQALLNDKALRNRLGENAHRFVQDNCTQEKAARQHLAVFRKVLGR